MARSHAAKAHATRAASRDEQLIARAEAAVARLSTHFAGWMQEECRRLEGLARRVEAEPSNAQARDQLFRAAHDVEGEASAFGFLRIERIAIGLCRLMSDAPDQAAIPFSLIGRHVAAVRLALCDEGDGEALADELERASAQYLNDARAAKTCPTIEGPPLAPNA